jgi:acyl carrier protein phosphodiesterase
MNYLAHMFLAGQREGLIVGNMLEDFISGGIESPQNVNLPREVKLGIRQHRLIDTMTDTDEHVKICKKVFYEEFGKFSPIVVDVLFDHFLIKNWEQFSSESFEDFRPRVYRAFLNYDYLQPPSMLKLINSMRENDWLKNYEYTWGLDRAFLNLNNKINRPGLDLRKSIDTYETHYELLNENFLLFFKKLKDFCDNFLTENPQNG